MRSLLTDGEGPRKECFKCHEVLPLSGFYKHPQMGDGTLGKCKRCTRRDVQENYWKNRDYYLGYEKRRYGPHKRAIIEASKQRHPTRVAARTKMKVAIEGGRLVRQPCEVCGATKVDGHHDDYSKPLEVRWLCRKHHGEAHRMERAS